MSKLDRTDKWQENQLRWVATWLPDVSFWVTCFPAVLTAISTISVGRMAITRPNRSCSITIFVS